MPDWTNMQFLNKIFSRLPGLLLAPAICPCCGKLLLDSEEGLCLECLSLLPRATGIDRVSIEPYLSNGVAPPGIAASWFLYRPDSPFAAIIRQAKYDGRPRLARELGRCFTRELMSRQLSGIGLAQVDVLLPVPMHISKRIKRGYNQADSIAAGISDITGIPVGDNLVATRRHSSQTRQSATRRRANVAGIIACCHAEELEGLNVAIVDDVITTGATITDAVLAISLSSAMPATIGALSLGLAGNR